MQRDRTFTESNLYKALSTVVRWSTLGAWLGIPLDKLEQIRLENYDVDEQKQGLISLIHKNYQFGWKDICVALEQMDESNLARKIRDQYIKHQDKKHPPRVMKAILLSAIVTAAVVLLLLTYPSHHTSSCPMPDQKAENVLTSILGRGDIASVQFILNEMHLDPRKCRDRYGNSLLKTAVKANNIEVVKYFVEEWNWNIICLDGWSEVHEACYLGNLDLLKYFLSRNATQCGSSLIDAAARQSEIKILHYLIDHGYQTNCTDHWSFMHEASYLGHLSVLRFYSDFVGKNMCSKCIDEYGNTLLHAATDRAALSEDQFAVVRYLLEEQHCDKTARNHNGQSPLDRAWQTGNQDIVEYLKKS